MCQECSSPHQNNGSGVISENCLAHICKSMQFGTLFTTSGARMGPLVFCLPSLFGCYSTADIIKKHETIKFI